MTRARTAEHNANIGAALRAKGRGSTPTKVCPRCKRDLPREEFGRRRNGHTETYCPPCRRELSAASSTRYAAGGGPDRAERRRLTNRRAQFKRKYGITVEDFERMKAEQSGGCAICGHTSGRRGTEGELYVDHCHETGKVRGLLCEPCNLMIGYAKDQPARLDAAAGYLRSR